MRRWRLSLASWTQSRWFDHAATTRCLTNKKAETSDLAAADARGDASASIWSSKAMATTEKWRRGDDRASTDALPHRASAM
ncbi:hypothetical protein VPH35_096253 [Triticum aestivum]